MLIDWKRIRASIAHDATIAYKYTDGNDHCVLGGLAVDYGVPLPRGSSNTRRIDTLTVFPRKLSEATGLSESQLFDFQVLNDNYRTVAIRRKRLILWTEAEERGESRFPLNYGVDR